MSLTVAERLQFLLENVYPRGRGPFTLTEVVDAIRFDGGSMTVGHLSQLLNGKRANPGLGVLREVCGFFRIPSDYFTDDEVAEQIMTDIKAIAAVRDSDAPMVLHREYDPYKRLTEWTTNPESPRKRWRR